MSNLRDPFNPKTGEFRDNIRSTDKSDLTELRQSMKQFGWRKEFPAYTDEHDVVLVGHRRLAVAKELGIKPVTVQLTLGDGDEADAERLKIAIASNIGFKEMTKTDRQRIAKYLYGEREWTMERIAEALNVTHKTISQDLRGFVPAVQTSRPKGGRPKGTTKAKDGDTSKPRPPKRTEAAKTELAAALVLDQGFTLERAATEVELPSVQVIKTGVAREEGRREGMKQASAELAASMTTQQKLEAAIRAHKRKLDIEFETRVLAECKRRLDDISLPHYAKLLEQLERTISNRKGIMDRTTYKKILACLHPDRVRDSVLKQRYEEAFRLFTELEKRVLDEKESPTPFRQMPRTYAELMEMRAKVQAERRAKRAAGKSAVSVR